MSMRNYGVERNGLAMTRDELQKLMLKGNKEIIEKYIVADSIEEIDEIDVDEFSSCIDYTNRYYEIEGSLYNLNDWGQMEFFDGDNIVITELEKDTLFEKYENVEEIKQELKDRYKQVGIELDDEFIEKHFGRFSGTYWG